MKTNSLIICSALSFELSTSAGKEVQLFPAGKFKAVDGRPQSISSVEYWTMDAAAAQAIIASLSSRINPLVIDYEHQTLNKEKNGQPAPAAGWFKNVEWREGIGLFATDVEWTPAAASAIRDGEYKFISPVLLFDGKTGRVTGLKMAALTNDAGIDGMTQVQLSAMSSEFFLNELNEGDQSMNKLLAAMLAALNLKAGTTEDEAIAALSSCTGKLVLAEQKVAALTEQTNTQATQLSAALSAGQAADPSQYVPIAAVKAMQEQLVALSTQVNQRQVDEVVEAALSNGQLLPAQETWARSLGNKDFPTLTAFLKDAPKLAALSAMQTANTAINVDGVALSADDLEAAKLLGQSHAEFAAGKKKSA